MARTKPKPEKDPIGELKELEGMIENFNDEIQNMTSKLTEEDMFNKKALDIIEKSIDEMHTLASEGNLNPEKDDNGTECIHGNDIHSNCSECDDLDDMEIVLNEIGNLIENEPNDKRLGEKIRDFYNKWLEFNQNNSDNTNKIDI